MSYLHLMAEAQLVPDDLERMRRVLRANYQAMLTANITSDGPAFRIDNSAGHITSDDIRRVLQLLDLMGKRHDAGLAVRS